VGAGAMLEHQAQIYCKACYRSLFGPKGYGFGGILAKDMVGVSSPEGAVSDHEDNVDSPRSVGGWVSPRLIRSTQKLLAEANLVCEKSPRLANYWAGGLSTESQRTSPRKVSAGFGSGVSSGRSVRNQTVDVYKNLSDVNQPTIKVGVSKSDEKVKKSSVVTPYKSATLPRFSSSSIPLIISESDMNKAQPQLGLRSAFNLPHTNTKSEIISSLPKPSLLTVKSSSTLSTADIPKLGYKPKASPWKASIAPSCSRCCKPVYQAELARASGSAWHKTCFTCQECGKLLDSTTLCDRGGDIFCRKCYSRNYGPKGVGFGIGPNLQS